METISITPDGPLADALEATWKKAGLPWKPGSYRHYDHLLGKHFQFYSTFGPHTVIVIGTITGIYFSVSDGGYVQLEVSSKRFHGREIVSLYWNGFQWTVLLKHEGTSEFSGFPEEHYAIINNYGFCPGDLSIL